MVTSVDKHNYGINIFYGNFVVSGIEIVACYLLCCCYVAVQWFN